MSVPNLVPIHLVDAEIFTRLVKHLTCCRGSVSGSSKSVVCILWGQWMSVQNFMACHPIDILVWTNLVNRPLVPKPNQTSRMCHVEGVSYPICTGCPIHSAHAQKVLLSSKEGYRKGACWKLLVNLQVKITRWLLILFFLTISMGYLEFSEQRIKLVVTLLQDHFWTCAEWIIHGQDLLDCLSDVASTAKNIGNSKI